MYKAHEMLTSSTPGNSTPSLDCFKAKLDVFLHATGRLTASMHRMCVRWMGNEYLCKSVCAMRNAKCRYRYYYLLLLLLYMYMLI